MNEFEPSPVLDIINRVLDGAANESERYELQQILAKNLQARDLYLRFANLHCTLRLMSGSFVPTEKKDVSVPKIPSSVPRTPSAKSWSSSVHWGIICASIAAVMLLAIWAFRVPDRIPDPNQPEFAHRNGDQKKVERAGFTLRVVEVHGKLEVIGEDRIVRAAAQGDEVPPGATLRSGEDGTKAIVELAGERLHLGTDTSVRWMKDGAQPPQIFVAHGDVRLEKIALKATAAFVLLTPHAEMRGDHGNTDVAVSAKSTRVAVNEGTVQLIRRSDQKRLDIAEGTWVYANADNDPMVPQRPERQAPEVVLKVRADRVALRRTARRWRYSPVRNWRSGISKQKSVSRFSILRKRVTGLSFNPNGDWLIVGDRAPFVQVWDWRNERLVRTLESPQPDELAYRPVFSPDGSKLYCSRHAGVFKGVCGWSTLDWQPLGVPTGKGKVKSFAPIPKTDLFAAGTGDGSLILWNSASEKQQEVLRHSKASIQGICASADGRLLAHTGPEGTVVWDLSERKVRWHFEGNGHLAFSLDGKLLAIASHGYLDFWNSETGQLLSTIRTENDQMQWLHFAPDGQTIFALSGARHRVVTWKIPSGTAF